MKSPLLSSKPLRYALLAVFAVLACELLFVFVVKPAFPITKINLNTSLGIPEAQLLDIAGISGKEYYFTLDSGAVRGRLLSIPTVADATVSMRFPDTVDIVLTPRSPRAVFLGQSGRATVAYYADKDGIIFRADSIGAGKAGVNVPIVSGVPSDLLKEGLKLPDSYIALMGAFARIQEGAPGLLDMFSEFRLDRSEYGTPELTIFPINSSVRVRTDDEVTPGLLRYCLLAADIVEKQGLTKTVNEIDFRTGTVVYRDTQQGGRSD